MARNTAADIQSLIADCSRLESEVTGLRSLGQSHVWVVPRFRQRIRYLAISGEAGICIESESFTLGRIGPFTLRLYPHGVQPRGGDGQCAVRLRLPPEAAANCGRKALPSFVDISVGQSSGRAALCAVEDSDGAISWEVGGLGNIDEHTCDEEDTLRVQAALPPLAGLASSKIASPPPSVASLSPFPAPAALGAAFVNPSLCHDHVSQLSDGGGIHDVGRGYGAYNSDAPRRYISSVPVEASMHRGMAGFPSGSVATFGDTSSWKRGVQAPSHDSSASSAHGIGDGEPGGVHSIRRTSTTLQTQLQTLSSTLALGPRSIFAKGTDGPITVPESSNRTNPFDDAAT